MRKGCFATGLTSQFLNCIRHLQLIIFIHCECYRTSCKSCNSPYIQCNSLQLNYNFVTTTSFQLLCNSPMTTIIMSSWRHFSSIHQNLTRGTMMIFCDFWNIDIHRPLRLFVLDALGLWHMAQSKVAMWHINWILETNIYMYLNRSVHSHR
jgi:hypothetical protein